MKGSLRDIMNDEDIIVEDSKMNWIEAVKIASEPLLNKDYITELYIDNMIKSVVENGPYMVLTDYFALMHAKAGEGVNKTCISLMVNKQTVDLEGKPVKIFMVLASIDTTSHIKYLQNISEILLEEENFKILLNGNKGEILKLLIN